MKTIHYVLVVFILITTFIAGFFVSKEIYKKPTTQTITETTRIDTIYVSKPVYYPKETIVVAPVVEKDSTMTNHQVARMDTTLTAGRIFTRLNVEYDTKPQLFSLQWETTGYVDSVYVFKDVVRNVYVEVPSKPKLRNVLPIIQAGCFLDIENEPSYSLSVGVRLWNRIDALLGTSTNKQLIVGIGYRM